MTEALVVQTAHLGDVILTTPLLEALARKHGPVDVVTAPAGPPLLETHPSVNRVYPFDKRGVGFGVFDSIRVARQLRKRHYDVVYLPHRSLRSAMLARLAKIRHRIGFSDSPGRFLYTESRTRTGAHEIERIFSLLGEGEPSRTSVALEEADRSAAVRALRDQGIDAADDYIVVAPGAMWKTKRWPFYKQLVHQLRHEFKVVAVGSGADRGLCGEPSPGGGERGGREFADLAGNLSIRESAAVIERAKVAVVNDSAPLHLAGAVGTPVVAVFGPTVPSQGFGPRDPRDQVAEIDGLWCRPCSRHGRSFCPLLTHHCMRTLSPAAVAELVESAVRGESS